MKKILALSSFLFWASLFLSAQADEQCRFVFVLGGDDKPYAWLENGQARGMNVDIMDALAREAGCSYEWASPDPDWQDAFKMLINGDISAMFLNPTKATDPYVYYIPESYVSTRYIFTRATDGPIAAIEGLKGKTVFVLEESHSYYFLEELHEELGFTVVGYPSVREALYALADGEGDALVTSLSLVATYDVEGIISGGVPVIIAPMALAVGKDHIDTYVRLNDAMEALKESGEYFDILKKWAMPQPKSPLLKYLALTAGFIGLLAFLIFLWAYSLRRQVRKKTGRLGALTRQLQTVLDTVQEEIYLINSQGETVWSNASDSGRFDKRSVQEKIRGAFDAHTPFIIEQIESNGEIWHVEGRFTGADGPPDAIRELLLVARNSTLAVKFRDEAIISSRLAALGEMSAIMAHEINNPLGLLTNDLGFIEQYTNEIAESSSREKICGMDRHKARGEAEVALKSMNDCLVRIKNTVADLSVFRRKDSLPKRLDLNGCAASAVKFSSLYIKKHTRAFRFEPSEISLPVIGVEFHIEQMIINLLHNACHALTDRNQAIVCTVAPSPDRTYMTVTVTDEGCGMDSGLLKQASDAFFTTRGDEGGTGLGLTIVTRLIGEYNGYYEIQSTRGAGTTVVLYFPVDAEADGL